MASDRFLKFSSSHYQYVRDDFSFAEIFEMSSERSDVAVVLLSISYNQIFLFEKSPPLSWFPFSQKECLSGRCNRQLISVHC